MTLINSLTVAGSSITQHPSVGQFHSSVYKWDLASSRNCKCSTSEQAANNILIACPIHWAPHGAQGLTVFNDELNAGLTTSLPASNLGSTAAWGGKRINPWPQSCLCLTWSGCPSK